MPETISAQLANITLPDTAGQQIGLGTLWESRPAVVVFLRHWGWIFCREHVTQLRDHQQEITAKGANIAAIGLGGMNFARQFREEFDIAFPLLVDEESQAHQAAGLGKANIFHLLRGDNAASRKRAKAAGFSQKGLGKDPFQLGGSFVFAPGNRVLYSHISRTFGDNAPVTDLVAAIPNK